MKSKLLFLPDIFLVVLICLSCERTEVQTNRKAADFNPTTFHQKGWSDFPIYSAGIREKLKWENMVDLANNKLGKLKGKNLQE